jgi:hypothetical protein
MTGSFLDELAAIREQLLKHSAKDLDVPAAAASSSSVPAPEDRDKLTPVVAAYRIAGALTAETAKQLLVDCCDEILRRNPTASSSPRPRGRPLRFDAGDERWGTGRQDRPRLRRQALQPRQQQPLAAAGHADVLVDWLQGLDAEIAARVEGESAGGAAS